MLPGQLTEGPHAGRWLDGHNARPAYHYIMLRALAHLYVALPKDDARRAEIKQALALGLKTRNVEILDQGAPTKDKAMEALAFVGQAFADDQPYLAETHTLEALDALGKIASAQAKSGSMPLDPRSWSMFLGYVLWKEKR